MNYRSKWINLHNKVKANFFLIDKNLWWGDDLDVRFYLLSRILKIKNKKILDIGCNIGITLSFLEKSNELYGIDIKSSFVNKSKKINPSASIHNASMNKLPFKSDFFDVIVLMNVFPSYDFKITSSDKKKFINETFDEIYRVLKKNGKIYLSTPNGDSFYYYQNKITYTELHNLLDQYKYEFKILGWNNIFSRRFSFLAKIFHPKILYMSDLIWRYLVKNMFVDVSSSKYYYVEARKINNEI
jgi:SAM-dependent methyltransferase